MPLAPGTRLGPYEILTPIGAGGMGEVFRSRDFRLEREAAIKVVKMLEFGLARHKFRETATRPGRPGAQ